MEGKQRQVYILDTLRGTRRGVEAARFAIHNNFICNYFANCLAVPKISCNFAAAFQRKGN